MFALTAKSPSKIAGRLKKNLSYNIWCWGTMVDILRHMVLELAPVFYESIDWQRWYFNDLMEISDEHAHKLADICLHYLEKHDGFPLSIPPTKESRELGDRNSMVYKMLSSKIPQLLNADKSKVETIVGQYRNDDEKVADFAMLMLFMKFSGGFTLS